MSDDKPIIDVRKTEDEWTWTVEHRTHFQGVAPTEAEALAAAEKVAESIADEPHGPA